MKNLFHWIALAILFLLVTPSLAQKRSKKALSPEKETFTDTPYKGLQWRNIGPFRGGRSVACTGVPGQPMVYYMGSTGGGIWKTEDAGLNWKNISDGFFNTGSVGAIAVSESDPNVVYAGMGEHAVRGVMTSHGDGMYKSVDAGRSWKHLGFSASRHIAEIRIHPQDPNIVYVAIQGALHGPGEERGVYKSTDGGQNWRKVLYVDENTGAGDISLDRHNPRILYAAMWDHRRFPWQMRSGGAGSGIYKSTDEGENWEKLTKGLPAEMGKAAVDVSPANPDIVYANIEAAKGGVFRSDDGGKSWKQTSSDRVTIARAWYYIEIFADPQDPETVYVLNAPVLKSIDGGKTFKMVQNPHGDQHHLWINPDNSDNMILSNDGGACITFNGGKSWSSQQNQPTAQFYRVITDNRFPYYIYGGQQDNSTVAIPNRTNSRGIGWKDWYRVAGGESAFLAFDPDDPKLVYGGVYQGNIAVYNHDTKSQKDIMAYPVVGLGSTPKDMRYRFNWNAPLVASPQDPRVIYHAANVVLRTEDEGHSWSVISPDLTRNEKDKQLAGGKPYTNEGAGGEVYNTISYLNCSPHQAGVIWVGSDDGLVHLSRDEGKNWHNVTPEGIGEAIINCIEVSPHTPSAAYVVAMSYKFNDFTPLIYYTENFGESWAKITSGIGAEDFVRVLREDPVRRGLLYAGTETGLYISFNNGADWHEFQLNLPVCPVLDLTVHDNDLIAATSGRAFWILDDLGAIQQSLGELNGQAILFQPKPGVKLDAPSEKIPNFGQNPLSGVIIDYYLPEDMDSMQLKMEVLDGEGNVIREYSNQKDKKFVRFPGGPSPAPLLPSKKDINRFNWDLRRASIPAVEKVFMFGDYRGSLVAPGSYTIRLISPQDTLTQLCSVLPDPRLNAKPEDFIAQQNMLLRIESAVRDIQQSVNRIREVKKQLEALEGTIRKMEHSEALADTAKVIIKKIVQWEEQLIQPKQKTFQDVINFPNMLNSELNNLRSRVGTHDPKVTAGAAERLEDLMKEWSLHKMEMQIIIAEDVANFNRLYKEKEVPAIVIPDPKP